MKIGDKINNREKICNIINSQNVLLTLEGIDERTITQWQYFFRQGLFNEPTLTRLIGYNFHPQDGKAYETRDKFLQEQNENQCI